MGDHIDGQTCGADSSSPAAESSEHRTVPLAIVGMACRFAGGITSPEKLWDFVSRGRDAWSKIPDDRFNLQAFYNEQADRPGSTHIRGGYFLEQDVGLFDPSFFNLSAEVAASMDPQIRMLLELTFESLESAGIPLQDVAGSKTSVFAGTFTKDYHDQLVADPLHIPRGFITGNYSAMVANRISHFFDLKGPSAAVDTGCSTSIVSLHLACQSLRSGESNCAIVGGACINLNPDLFASLSTLGSCGPDGKCYAFDHRAQGYGRGEGGAILVVKRLEDALRDRDPIRAVIRETATNQDGKSATITSPDGAAQHDLIRACYERAGLDPLDTVVAEAHGTGTKAGDPIEADAIGRALRPPSRRKQARNDPVHLASVKTNLGHTEAASGLASVIKMAKSLENGQIAPSLNFEQPNPEIDLDGLGLKINLKLKDWPAGRALRGSVNNFGYGGTNAHVIMDGSPRLAQGEQTAAAKEPEASKLFILSARDDKTVRRMVSNLRNHLQGRRGKQTSLSDVAYTLGQRRSMFSWSAAVSASSHEDLVQLLSDDEIKPVQAPGRKPQLGFIFNGQGAQWFAMGRELMDVYPTYVGALQRCDEAIKRFGADWSLIAELKREKHESRVDQVRFSMPLTCAVQVALVLLLEEWGVTPSAVTGHSTGEVAAAFASGAVSLEEAMAITFFRGLVNSQHITGRDGPGGAMLAVGLGPEQAQPYVATAPGGKVVVACLNSPSSVTLSGDAAAIEAVEQKLTQEGVFARKLKVQAAFHSHHMVPLAESYGSLLNKHMRLDKRAFNPSVKYYSPVTGAALEDAGQLGPSNWVENMLRPVRFSEAFTQMVLAADPDGDAALPQQGVDFAVELGPHGTLAGPIRQLLNQPDTKDMPVGYCSGLERGKNAVETMQKLAGRLIQEGCPVDVSRVNFPSGTPHGLVTVPDLPSYPWNHSTRFWVGPRISQDHRFRKLPPHEFVGVRVPGIGDQSPVWRHVVRCSDLPWVRDHVVQSQIVYPGAGFVAMAIEAMRQTYEREDKAIAGYFLRDVEISKALIVPDDAEGVEVQLSLELPDDRFTARGWHRFRICSAQEKTSPWSTTASGLVSVQWREDARPTSEGFMLRSTAELVGTPPADGAFAKKMKPRELFGTLRGLGIQHGPLFQNLDGPIMLAEGEALAGLTVAGSSPAPTRQPREPHVIHTITLDSVFLAAYPCIHASSGGHNSAGAAVPRSIRHMYVSADISTEPGSRLRAHSVLRQHSKQGFHVSAVVRAALQSAPGSPVIEIDDMRFQSLGHVGAQQDQAQKELCLATGWNRSFALNDPAGLVAQLQTETPEGESKTGRDVVRAAYYLVSDALKRLTDEDLSNLEWHHKRLHQWMLRLEQQAANDELGPKSSQWASTSEGVKQMLIDKAAKASVNGALAVRVGRELLGIMRQQVAPLELMLRDQLLYEFYQHSVHFVRSTAHAAALARAMAEERPGLRVLEIGAGTAGCTLPVLEAIGGETGQSAQLFGEYVFTDVSAGFFKAAREKLAAWGDAITYTALDIEKDPAAQGFDLGSYDLIIAAQVLHATKNIKTTIGRVRSLLKDSGRLVLVETTRDTAEMHLIFGVLPGWWLSEEPERQYSPTMSLESWDACLRESGFTGLDTNIWDCDDPEHHTTSCIVSSVAARAPPVLAKTATLVFDDGSRPPETWTRELAASFARDLDVALDVKVLSDELVPDGAVCIFLSGLGGQPQTFDEPAFRAVKALVTRCKGLLWVTTGSAVDCEIPENAVHLGLLRTARLEDTSKRYASLDLDPSQTPWTAGAQYALARVFPTIMDWSAADLAVLDFEYAVRNSELLVPRMDLAAPENEELVGNLGEKPVEMQKFVMGDRRLRLFVDSPGLLDSVVFREDPDAGLPLPQGFIEIEPHAFGLNFRDVMGAMGMLKEDKQEMGVECSGVVTRIGPPPSHGPQPEVRVGDRVCCLSVNGHFGNRVRIPWTSAARIPADMSFETAASFPLAFVTAYHSMFEAGRCEPGDTVLIHAATGGVGQACLILAQWKGIDVLVTAGTQEKRDFLVNQYGVAPDRIFSSRDESFVQGVLNATEGRGVDVVINSLTGNLLHESWGLLAPYGRFIEIGKRDIQLNHALEMEPFQKALSFVHVDIKQMCNTRGAIIQRTLQQVLFLMAGATIPNMTPVESIPLGEASRAFRKMQAGKHIGKIVLVPSPDELVKTIPSAPKTSLRHDVTYMIVGGVSGIGLSISRWFVDHGARNLLLVSRNAASRFKDSALGQQLAAGGATVAVKDCDVGDMSALERVVDECRSSGMPDVRGVVYGGMVLEDSILEQMTFPQWNRALHPKLVGTRNIDALLGRDLDFFVMLSSCCGVLGNPSQANYAAGNTYQDAVARHRSARGLPAVTIDLGVVESVGFVADTQDEAASDRLLKVSGHPPLSEAEVLGLIEAAIRKPCRPVRASQIASGMSGSGSAVRHDARYAMLRQRVGPRRGGGAGAAGSGSGSGALSGPGCLYEKLSQATSLKEAAAVAQMAISAKISDMFALGDAEVNPSKSLAHYGVDSLVAVELRNWLVPAACVELSIFELLGSSSVSELALNIVKRVRPVF